MTGYEEVVARIVEGLAAFIALIIGWTLKLLKKDLDDKEQTLKDLEVRLQKVEVDLPKTYITKEDFHHFEDRLFPILHKLDAKLDNKVDKQ
jgi:hypothetical protein